MEERLVSFRPRAVLVVLGIILAAVVLIEIIQAARGILIWIFAAIFLATALNPAVDALQRRGVARRGLAVTIVFVGAILAIVALAATIIPTIVAQVNDFIDAVPGYVEDLTAGRGRLGFLEREYQITERVREALSEGGAARVLGISGTALAVTKGVVTAVVATLTIAFLTLFMLLEGPAWVERLYSLLPEQKQPRWRKVGHDIYRTIGGYVTGNLAISLIAGVVSTAVLLGVGVPFAVALGLLVAILDLIPLAGATIAAILVSTVAFLDSTTSGRDRAGLLHRLPAAREPRAPAGRLQPDGATLAARGADRGPDRRRARGRDRRSCRDPGRRRNPGASRRLAPAHGAPGTASRLLRRTPAI